MRNFVFVVVTPTDCEGAGGEPVICWSTRELAEAYVRARPGKGYEVYEMPLGPGRHQKARGLRAFDVHFEIAPEESVRVYERDLHECGESVSGWNAGELRHCHVKLYAVDEDRALTEATKRRDKWMAEWKLPDGYDKSGHTIVGFAAADRVFGFMARIDFDKGPKDE